MRLPDMGFEPAWAIFWGGKGSRLTAPGYPEHLLVHFDDITT